MGGIQVVYERCCGLDIHKRTVVACMIVPGAPGVPGLGSGPDKQSHMQTRTHKEIKSFGTDHNAYHIGELAIMRQVMETWPKNHR